MNILCNIKNKIKNQKDPIFRNLILIKYTNNVKTPHCYKNKINATNSEKCNSAHNTYNNIILALIGVYL